MGIWVSDTSSGWATVTGRPWHGYGLGARGVWAWRSLYIQPRSVDPANRVCPTRQLATPADYVELRAIEIAKQEADHAIRNSERQTPKLIDRSWPSDGMPESAECLETTAPAHPVNLPPGQILDFFA